ncbi:MAG TPA: hypothetical protein VKC63_09575 [Solirubrobacterales bacterium]|nr:hypothetical protein [Solirubrobacterales bacterium]
MSLVTPAAMLAELRAFSRRQWTVAAISGTTFLLMGIVGETLPGASLGHTVPVEWWNYVTLVLSPVFIGLIALLSILLLAVTLALRLSSARVCEIPTDAPRLVQSH